MKSADKLLAGQQTRYQLSKTFYVPNPQCAATREGYEICHFRAGSNTPLYRELAQLVKTTDKLNVLCELPLTDPNKTGTCTAHRHDDDDVWEPLQRLQSAKQQGDDSTSEQKSAHQALSKLRTALEMSQYLGVAPDQCLMVSSSELECMWTAARATPGYARAMFALNAGDPFKVPAPKLRFVCRLPLDGTARAADSCGGERWADPTSTQLF